jgi:hypothetical protein
MIADRTVRDLLDEYLLTRETSKNTDEYYRKTVSIFCGTMGSGWLKDFHADNVSKFLAIKQHDEKSSYYRKSLRNGLVALLRFHGDCGRVRSVRLAVLDHAIWTAGDVRKLIDACQIVFQAEPRECQFWQTLIAAAWYSGLSAVDLHLLERRHVEPSGRVKWSRTKTGVPVITFIPPSLVAHVVDGPAWPLRTSKEWFRRTFQRIVKESGLRGSFKMLRRSCGSSIESLHPGRGHEHLGNSRAIFERHYDFSEHEPMKPESL